jgi:hypothetical protein
MRNSDGSGQEFGRRGARCREKPGAPSGASRNLQKGEGSLQDGDQGGEDRGAPEGPVSGKSGGSVVSCVQTDHQQEEGSSNGVDDDPGQRGELGRKPEDDPARIAKREPRGPSGTTTRPERLPNRNSGGPSGRNRRRRRASMVFQPQDSNICTRPSEEICLRCSTAASRRGGSQEYGNRRKSPGYQNQEVRSSDHNRKGVRQDLGNKTDVPPRGQRTAIGQTVRIQKRQGDDRGNR